MRSLKEDVVAFLASLEEWTQVSLEAVTQGGVVKAPSKVVATHSHGMGM